MWVHGNIAQVQYPDAVKRNNKFDYGAEFVAINHHENWFHFPIPTPVIIDDARPQLVKIFVLYNARTYVKITELRVYDGQRPVKSFENLNWSDDHSFSVQPENSRTIDPPDTIFFGLGISVRVSFIADTANPINATITFTSAGADFKPSP